MNAIAETRPTDVITLKPKQSGYAAKHPIVLTHQVLFGRAHGVGLLAAACDSDPRMGRETRVAYEQWHERQIHVIAKMAHDLARWYFTSEAQHATDADIVRALNLKPRLDPKPSASELKAACETFPQMLRGDRYDLATLLTHFSNEAASVGKPDEPLASTSRAKASRSTLQ
jgi:hypothetical protein